MLPKSGRPACPTRFLSYSLRPHRPIHRCYSSASTSTAHTHTTPNKPRFHLSNNVRYFLLGSAATITLTGLGYYYLNSNKKDSKVKYGSAPAFQQAVRILCLTFPEEGKVTTDYHDLIDHGFSPYDYHPGVSINSWRRANPF